MIVDTILLHDTYPKDKKVKNLFLPMNIYFLFCYNMNCDNTTSLITYCNHTRKTGNHDESYDVFLLTITYNITLHLFLEILSMIFHYICYICAMHLFLYAKYVPIAQRTHIYFPLSCLFLTNIYIYIYMKERLPNADPPIKTYPFK